MAEITIIPHTLIPREPRSVRDKGFNFSLEILDFAKTNVGQKKNFNSLLFNRLNLRDKLEGVPRANIVSAHRCIINESCLRAESLAVDWALFTATLVALIKSF